MEKETIELVKKMIEDGNLSQEIAEKYCPELKSEDERIRKALIEGFKVMKDGSYGECTFSNYNIPVTDIIAWLEKQGNINPTEDELEALRMAAYEPTKNWSEKLQSLYMKLSHCEQGEQKIDSDTLIQQRVDALADIVEEQKPAWSEEDEDYYDAIIAKLEVTQDDALLTDNQMRFLKSLKDRVQPKQEWSKEDERNASYICAALDCYYRLREDRKNTNGQEDLDNARNWLYNRLKSIRPQKPLTNEEIEQAKKEYRDVALSKINYIPEELTYDDVWDDAISYMKSR